MPCPTRFPSELWSVSPCPSVSLDSCERRELVIGGWIWRFVTHSGGFKLLMFDVCHSIIPPVFEGAPPVGLVLTPPTFLDWLTIPPLSLIPCPFGVLKLFAWIDGSLETLFPCWFEFAKLTLLPTILWAIEFPILFGILLLCCAPFPPWLPATWDPPFPLCWSLDSLFTCPPPWCWLPLFWFDGVEFDW